MPVKRPGLVASLMDMPRLGPWLRASHDYWLVAKYHLDSRFISNRISSRSFDAHRPALTKAQQRVVGDLMERGVAKVSFTELFEEKTLWERLSQEAVAFAQSDAVNSRIQTLKQQPKEEEPISEYNKTGFIVQLFADNQSIDPDNVWLQAGLQAPILDVVNSYMGMWAKLNALNLWYTIPSEESRGRVASQRWHRDPEDQRILKVFLYFSDVREDSGPLEYIPGSRRGGVYADLWPLPKALGVSGGGYPPQEAVEENVPSSERVTCTGPAGTLVFCDTTAFHRGGYAVKHPRILAVWTFLTPASVWARRFRLKSGECAGFSSPARFALEV